MSAPCGKTNQSPQTIAVFKKLGNQSANKTCFDCNAKNCTWATIPYGVFICLNCAGFHRSLGTHISFVRSTQLDDWTPEQLARMVHGGNAKARKFFKERGGLVAASSGQLQQKYCSDVANLYKTQLGKLASGGYDGMVSPPSSPGWGPSEPAPIQAEADDFFNSFDLEKKGTDMQRSGSDGALSRGAPQLQAAPIKRSSSTGSMPASSNSDFEAEFQSAVNVSPPATEDWSTTAGDDDWGAPPQAAASDAPKQVVKVIAPKTRSSAIGGKKGATKKPVKAKAVAVKVGGSDGGEAVAAPKKASKADDWGDMDSFDDSKWDAIQKNSAKAEADANKPKELVFAAPQAAPGIGGRPTAKVAAQQAVVDEEPSIVIVDKNWNKGKKAQKERMEKKAALEAQESDTLRSQYAGAKSISSDQAFGREDTGPKHYDQFAGQTSLGSDQYFGRTSGMDDDDDDYDDDDLDGLVSNLAEETRRDLEVAGQMVGQFISGLSDRYG